MRPTRKPRVKICCIRSVEEAWMAIGLGASALGLVSAMPSGPGVIEEASIAEIVSKVPPPIATFLLTSQQDVPTIVAQQRRTGANSLQLCDRLEPGSHAALRRALPGISIVQVIHVSGESSLEEAVEVAPYVHALLLDSGNPSLAVKVLGGTGRAHNWTISRRIREGVPVPIFLAGGLNVANVAEAMRLVNPFGIDLCSSVRTNGHLDRSKLAAFFEQVNSLHD